MMKILMLVNWKISYEDKEAAKSKQPPDYYITGEPYWFFRYFKEIPQVDVIDVSSVSWLENFEREKLRFYVWQTLRAIPKIGKYDLIISHGMQSAVVLSSLRRLFKTKAKHMVFEIGSFNSAATTGGALRLMQFASKSIDGFIYHTSQQIEYYREYFPWIVSKAHFMCYGADTSFFVPVQTKEGKDDAEEILCIGYRKRDWKTLLEAFDKLCETTIGKTRKLQLTLIGKKDLQVQNERVSLLPYIPIEALKQEIAKAAVCVVPLEDFNYSFGQMTLLQQMAMKKAVIVAKVPSVVDYVEDGKTALFYESQNSEDLCSKMVQLLEDRDLATDIARQGANAVKNIYSEERMAADIEEVIKLIMNED